MNKVFALYCASWSSGSMPVGMYNSEELAFQAMSWYATNMGWERRDMNVVSFLVHTSLGQ